VLSTSWLSRALDSEGDKTVNRRGVATLLAVANYVKSELRVASRSETCSNLTADWGNCAEYSMWSKDIIFLVSDGYEEGAQAWLDAYHGAGQSSQWRAQPSGFRACC
jgi:glycosylphosphatidylinositol transamidase